jgi:hypothetical protein
MADENRSSDRLAIALLLLCEGLFVFCTVTQWWGAKTSESNWLIALLFIPLGIQALCWRGLFGRGRWEEDENLKMFCHFFIWTTFFNITSYCILWMLYLKGRTENYYSYGVLVLILIMAAIVLKVTYIIMRQFPEPVAPEAEGAQAGNTRASFGEWYRYSLPRLKKGLEQKPFWALLHFFAMFLGVAYLFGFAFAFHDQSRVKEVDGKRVYSTMPPLYTESPNFRGESERGVKTKDKKDDLEGCFYFPTLRAEMEMEKEPPREQRDTKITSEMERKWHNFDELERLLTHIEKGWDDKLVRITLVGRASTEPITLPDRKNRGKLAESDNMTYLSNYELSQARTQAVKYEVLGRLIEAGYEKWRNIEWMSVPLSNEQSSRSNIRCPYLGGEGSEPTDNNKIVKAFVEVVPGDAATGNLGRFYESEPKPLDLLGYMYFSVYTITTTGYGDIMPTSNYARFLAALANIFEMFFIVGFLNTLISLKK